MANAKPSGPGRKADKATGPGGKGTPAGVRKVRRGDKVFEITEAPDGVAIETRVDSASDLQDGVSHEDAETEE